jgi:hypothetical protein
MGRPSSRISFGIARNSRRNSRCNGMALAANPSAIIPADFRIPPARAVGLYLIAFFTVSERTHA